MFTGIVEELGHITEVTPLPDDSLRMRVRGPLVTSDAAPGDSIAVNGVCLTVVEVIDGDFTTDVMRETLERSSLRGAAPGVTVNLERAVRADARLGGHIVQGHVDGTGQIISRRPSENWELVRVSLPPSLERYIVEKGSVTVDGVSLTVTDVDHDPDGTSSFGVSLIPTTLTATTLGHRQPGETVNLEVDVLAKYVERLLEARGES